MVPTAVHLNNGRYQNLEASQEKGKKNPRMSSNLVSAAGGDPSRDVLHGVLT